jgi:hypothetical protein
MSRFAANTSIGVERSQEEIRNVLRRYGVTSFGTMEHDGRAAVQFMIQTLSVKMQAPLPVEADQRHTPTG